MREREVSSRFPVFPFLFVELLLPSAFLFIFHLHLFPLDRCTDATIVCIIITRFFLQSNLNPMENASHRFILKCVAFHSVLYRKFSVFFLPSFSFLSHRAFMILPSCFPYRLPDLPFAFTRSTPIVPTLISMSDYFAQVIVLFQGGNAEEMIQEAVDEFVEKISKVVAVHCKVSMSKYPSCHFLSLNNFWIYSMCLNVRNALISAYKSGRSWRRSRRIVWFCTFSLSSGT